MATKGYIAYTAKFGYAFPQWEVLPWQAQPHCGAYLPFSIEDDERIGRLLGDCADNGREVTAKETVDCLHLHNGEYSAFGVKAKTYEDFLYKVATVDVLT